MFDVLIEILGATGFKIVCLIIGIVILIVFVYVAKNKRDSTYLKKQLQSMKQKGSKLRAFGKDKWNENSMLTLLTYPKITKADLQSKYDSIKTGQSLNKIIDLLGKEESWYVEKCYDKEIEVYQWSFSVEGEGTNIVKVGFVNGLVVVKTKGTWNT